MQGEDGGVERIVVIREPRCVTEGPEGDSPRREGREVERRVNERTSVTTPLANSWQKYTSWSQG